MRYCDGFSLYENVASHVVSDWLDPFGLRIQVGGSLGFVTKTNAVLDEMRKNPDTKDMMEQLDSPNVFVDIRENPNVGKSSLGPTPNDPPRTTKAGKTKPNAGRTSSKSRREIRRGKVKHVINADDVHIDILPPEEIREHEYIFDNVVKHELVHAWHYVVLAGITEERCLRFDEDVFDNWHDAIHRWRREGHKGPPPLPNQANGRDPSKNAGSDEGENESK